VIVVDTNVIAYLLIPGPHQAAVEAIRERDDDWRAPPLWQSEFRNVLTLCLRRKAMPLDVALETFALAQEVLAAGEIGVDGALILARAARLNLTAYDAEFVVLAEALDVPLVTLDREILVACAPRARTPEAFLRGR
jgi:predicted nucleic acid-binding protein